MDKAAGIPNQFTTTVEQLRDGQTLLELHLAVQKIVGDVLAVGKPGHVTLKIQVAPTKAPGTLLITDEVVVKEPKADREVTVLYADKDHTLSRRDPRQPKLDGLEKPGEVRNFPVAVAVGQEQERTE